MEIVAIVTGVSIMQSMSHADSQLHVIRKQTQLRTITTYSSVLLSPEPILWSNFQGPTPHVCRAHDHYYHHGTLIGQFFPVVYNITWFPK